MVKVTVGATLLLLTGAWTVGCTTPSANRPPARQYRLGFSATPPRLELASILQTIEQWTKHGDAALLLIQPPWRSLLVDTSGLPGTPRPLGSRVRVPP